MNPEMIAQIIQYILLGIQVSEQLLKASAELKDVLATARAAGGVTDEQWAELEAKLADAEAARRAAVAQAADGQ